MIRSVDRLQLTSYINYNLLDAERRLEDLPSAHPELCEDAVSRAEIVRWTHFWFQAVGLKPDRFIAGIKRLPSAQPEQQWIPCSERLPHAEQGKSEFVLATCGFSEIEDARIRWIRSLYFNGDNWCCPTGEAYLRKVYARMPFPKPYREEGDE